jgi:hypothetical protein
MQCRNVPSRHANKFRAGPYKRLRDLHQVSDGTFGQFPDSPGRPQVKQHPPPAHHDG